MTKTRTFTREEHEAFGKELFDAKFELVRRVSKVSNTYGVTSKAAKLAQKALRAIDELRCEMDNRLVAETTHKEWDEQRLDRVYYPGDDSKLEGRALVEASDDQMSKK